MVFEEVAQDAVISERRRAAALRRPRQPHTLRGAAAG